MTALDVLAAYRAEVAKDLQRAVGAVSFSHAAMLGEQLERAVEAEAAEPSLVLLPGAVCLCLAEILGGPVEGARAPAAALCVLALAGSVFAELEASAGADRLSARWGLPRALNAADAFISVAQDSLMRFHGLDDLAPAIAMLAALDAAERDLAEAVLRRADAFEAESAGSVVRSLMGAAYTLAGLATGQTPAAIEILGERGRGIALGMRLDLRMPGSGAESMQQLTLVEDQIMRETA
jgi:hypothetical protein